MKNSNKFDSRKPSRRRRCSYSALISLHYIVRSTQRTLNIFALNVRMQWLIQSSMDTIPHSSTSLCCVFNESKLLHPCSLLNRTRTESCGGIIKLGKKKANRIANNTLSCIRSEQTIERKQKKNRPINIRLLWAKSKKEKTFPISFPIRTEIKLTKKK